MTWNLTIIERKDKEVATSDDTSVDLVFTSFGDLIGHLVNLELAEEQYTELRIGYEL